MIRGRLKLAQCIVTLVVFLMPLLAFALAAYFRFATRLLPNYSSDADPSSYFGLLLLTTVLWAIAAEHYELTSLRKQLLAKTKTSRAVAACLLTYVAVLSITFFYRVTTFSRIFIWLSALNLCLLTLLAQAMFNWSWARSRFQGKAAFQVLIVGADEFAKRVADVLLADRVATCSIKGYVRLPRQTRDFACAPAYELSDIDKLAIGNGIDDFVLAISPEQLGDLLELRRCLSPICAPIRLALDVGEAVDTSRQLFTLGDLLMVDPQTTPADSTLYIILKRAFDLLFSGAVLILAAPVFAMIALAILLSSPGPVIFVQERVGLNGKLFRMFKI